MKERPEGCEYGGVPTEETLSSWAEGTRALGWAVWKVPTDRSVGEASLKPVKVEEQMSSWPVDSWSCLAKDGPEWSWRPGGHHQGIESTEKLPLQSAQAGPTCSHQVELGAQDGASGGQGQGHLLHKVPGPRRAQFPNYSSCQYLTPCL